MITQLADLTPEQALQLLSAHRQEFLDTYLEMGGPTDRATEQLREFEREVLEAVPA